MGRACSRDGVGSSKGPVDVSAIKEENKASVKPDDVDQGDDDSLSEYMDENAESDEVDENPQRPKMKKLYTHDMNIKQIDKMPRCYTQAINFGEDSDEDDNKQGQPKREQLSAMIPRK